MPEEKQPDKDTLAADRRVAQEKLIYSKFYKILAIAFTLGAFVVMISIYKTMAGGEAENILQRPFLLVLLLLPFVPPYFLAILSKRRRKEALKVLEPHYSKPKPSDKAA